jgi:hypothetical protein
VSKPCRGTPSLEESAEDTPEDATGDGETNAEARQMVD